MSDDRPLQVTQHAIAQFQRRTRDTRDGLTVRDEIKAATAAALKAGRVANHKTKGFGLYGETKLRNLPKGQLFLWDEEGRVGFIIAREPDADVVITTLTRSWAAA